VPITDDNLVVVSDIVVTDSAADTAASLNPTPNTLINTPTGGGDPVSSGGGGGAIGWLLLLGLVVLQRSRLIKS